MKKEFVGLFLICSVFLFGLVNAVEIPEDFEIPDEVTPEMIDQIPEEYLDPAFYDSMLPDLIDSYCPLVESYKSNIVGQEIPKQIPFTTEVFSLYIAKEPIASVFLEDKKVSDLICGSVAEDTTYNIYVSSLDLINEVDENTNPLDFYKEKRKSGEIQIKAVGFGKTIKLFFLDIGVDIASWFV